jgi:hypothetical protein
VCLISFELLLGARATGRAFSRIKPSSYTQEALRALPSMWKAFLKLPGVPHELALSTQYSRLSHDIGLSTLYLCGIYFPESRILLGFYKSKILITEHPSQWKSPTITHNSISAGK